ncbi:arsenate reductase ArsC [Microbacterium aurantiacum]|uniref:arsenate reductase ArsC n=1 Tax=Microbacterium aurantiacum TaxID=162393 RepID=UPI003D72343D
MSAARGQAPLQSPDAVLHRAAERLAHQFAGMVSEETVERVVYESYTALGRTARVSTHLASLAEKFARDRLTALAQSRGLIVKTVPEVLYVCVQNSGRSQMAAALTRHLAGDRVHVRSAGSQPGEGILPTVVEALAEIGIDVSEEFPKPLTDDVVRAADAVITMGCGDACPIYPGKRYLDWELTDPADLSLADVRVIRDDIRARIADLLDELGATEGLAAGV